MSQSWLLELLTSKSRPETSAKALFSISSRPTVPWTTTSDYQPHPRQLALRKAKAPGSQIEWSLTSGHVVELSW